jgi:hypothetical protein
MSWECDRTEQPSTRCRAIAFSLNNAIGGYPLKEMVYPLTKQPCLLMQDRAVAKLIRFAIY